MTVIPKYLLIFTLQIWGLSLFASPQVPDYIIYENDTIATYNLIVEQYLQGTDAIDTEKLFSLDFRTEASFNCWRGYQAIYKIQNDSLFLIDMIDCGTLGAERTEMESLAKIKSIFGDKVVDGKVFIDWFTGYLSLPLTDKVLRWDGVFYKTFEKEKVFTVANGEISKVEDVENYVDDPRRIDRRDKNKISRILFKQLKRVKWKNTHGFDCSDEYIITIDENGRISKVNVFRSDEDTDEHSAEDEYNFCINNIYNALKPLKFDIIKDKGMPISEDIYIDIWVEDNGKIENWTDTL